MSAHRSYLFALVASLLVLSACAAGSHKEAPPSPQRSDTARHYAKPAPMRQIAPPAPEPSLDEAEYEEAEEIAYEETPMAPTDNAVPVEPNAEQDHATTGEAYKDYGVNRFTDPHKDRFSTFAIDVDTASYTIARRKINEGTLPPAASVRVEEFVNFFDYDYAQPEEDIPFAVDFEAAPSPFTQDTYYMRVGVQGVEENEETRKPIHLVFLVDTSGSMQARDKIGLLKESLKILVGNLGPEDSVAIGTYAGRTARLLAPTSAADKSTIFRAIDSLSAGGGTAMGSGLEMAYQMAYENLQSNATTRVIVCSDGDANIGPSSHQDILRQISDYTKEGVTLSTIGFGRGNYKDVLMEQLANQGDGNYYYIDTHAQAEKIFGEDLMGTLVVIAKDVKIQVEFDPKQVESYRLIGYENRDVADKDFRNDAVDAGEIGAGHSVTALYEVKLRKNAKGVPATVRIRHKAPQGGSAEENIYDLDQQEILTNFQRTSRDFQLAVSAASFAEILRGSPYAEGWSLKQVRNMAERAAGNNADARELVSLIDRASHLQNDLQASR